MRGDRLRALRQERNFTQESLAERLGLGLRQIWRYENGETEPDGSTVAKIARILGTSTDYLPGLTDDSLPYPLSEGDLSPKERTIVSMVRQGDKLSAIEIIMSGE